MSRLRPTAGAPIDRRDPLLDDPALAEALAACAGVGRLSDADVRAMRANRRRAIASVTSLALVAMIGVALWQARPPAAQASLVAHYETQRGQQRAVRLADGSELRLSGATRVVVTFAGDRRDVRLDRGEAYFDIVHDPARPFTVHAGASGARVLGTAFDLDLRRGQVELAVYRGAVRFGRDGTKQDGVVVEAGWRSHFDGLAAASPRRFDVAQQDWRQGWLDTEDMRLGDLVDALNRQGGPLVQTPPAALADMPVAGRFRLDDPVQLLDAIGAAYGFAVKREGDQLRLVQDRSESRN
jgi:transmembrane sensor